MTLTTSGVNHHFVTYTNDNPTPARIAPDYDDRSCGADADSANAML
jgi:hypothetical protein